MYTDSSLQNKGTLLKLSPKLSLNAILINSEILSPQYTKLQNKPGNRTKFILFTYDTVNRFLSWSIGFKY